MMIWWWLVAAAVVWLLIVSFSGIRLPRWIRWGAIIGLFAWLRHDRRGPRRDGGGGQ